jgi:hypothetical protein
MHVGKRFNCTSANTISRVDEVIPWVNEIRFLDVNFIASCKFKCSFSYAKRSLCRVVNALFGKIGPHSKADVIMHMIKFKCMPLLLYGTESCPLTKAGVQSLEFTVMWFLMKIFKSSNRDLVIIIASVILISVLIPSDLIESRQANFTAKLDKLSNSIYILLVNEVLFYLLVKLLHGLFRDSYLLISVTLQGE